MCDYAKIPCTVSTSRITLYDGKVSDHAKVICNVTDNKYKFGGLYIFEPTFDSMKLDPDFDGEQPCDNYMYFASSKCYWLKKDYNEIKVYKNDEYICSLLELEKNRYISELGLPEYDSNLLVASKYLSDFFEEAIKDCPNTKSISNWIMGDLARIMSEKELDYIDIPFKGAYLAKLVNLIDSGKISSAIAKKVFEEMFETGKDPEVIIEEKHMKQI